MTPAERRASIRHYAERRAKIAGLKVSDALRRQRAREPRTVAIPDLSPHDIRRLWSLIRRGEPDACWPWLGALGAKGYGRFKVDGRLYLPHRLVQHVENGPIVDVAEYHGSVVMHACDNPLCCNPRHLSAGRQVANVADMFAKGRAHQCRLRVPSPVTGGA